MTPTASSQAPCNGHRQKVMQQRNPFKQSNFNDFVGQAQPLSVRDRNPPPADVERLQIARSADPGRTRATGYGHTSKATE
jgi:hypothetical protein